ncbi:type VI secretion lipoprotein TssJ [Serratia liquefaciens]|uniref:type VI secretion lipoprotein TssJ n=1 Tax=Serratia liquefaciens TaxID=614 RepID=UPI00165CF138|nr:type VI secretion lipoprotein TssJ [Serratia liquefaciens]QNQ55459.1 type VI secretion lipoprotein TssJ [Serratia liquefaciens]
MKLHGAMISLALSIFMISGCAMPEKFSQEEALQAVTASYAGGAIVVQLRAEPTLNTVNGLANSCTVLLLQAKDKASLNKILSNPAALKGLFSGVGAEGTLLQVDRYTMMPGQDSTLHINRAQNTRSVALVAGYYPYPMKQHRVLVDIPVKSAKSGWWKPEWWAGLGPLNIAVTMGSDRIFRLEEVQKEGKSTVVSATTDYAAEDEAEEDPVKGEKS